MHFLITASDIILHRVGEVCVRVELVDGDVTCRCVQELREAVYDGRAGVLDGRRLHYVELGFRLPT